MNWKRLAARVLFGSRWFKKTRYPTSYSASVDKTRIKQALSDARLGDTRSLTSFYAEMRATNADLGSHVRKIELALQQTPMEMSPVDDSPLAETIAEDCRAQVTHPDLDLPEIIAHALWCILCGHGGFEMILETERLALTAVPVERYWWESGVMMVQPGEDPSVRVPVEELGIAAPVIVMSPATAERDLVGPMRSCVTAWLTARWGLEWWSSAVERGGEPFRYASYQPSDDPEGLLDSLKEMGSGGVGVFPAGVDLHFLENASTFAARPHQEIVEFCERAMAKALLGGTQTADIQRGSGSKASAGVHQDIFDMFVDGYAMVICNFLRKSVLQPYVAFKYGAARAGLTPTPVIRAKRYGHLLEFFTALEKAKNAGVKTIPVSWVHAQSGIPMAEEGEPVLEGSQPLAVKPLPEPDGEDEPAGDADDDQGSVTESRASVRRGATLPALSTGLPELENWAARLARGSGKELTDDIQKIIDQAEKDGATLTQLYSRVIQRSGVPPESPLLVDLLAGVQLEATMRGFTSRRR